jgi:hypothetical protein
MIHLVTTDTATSRAAYPDLSTDTDHETVMQEYSEYSSTHKPTVINSAQLDTTMSHFALMDTTKTDSTPVNREIDVTLLDIVTLTSDTKVSKSTSDSLDNTMAYDGLLDHTITSILDSKATATFRESTLATTPTYQSTTAEDSLHRGTDMMDNTVSISTQPITDPLTNKDTAQLITANYSGEFDWLELLPNY